jgi:hypothetical protein
LFLQDILLKVFIQRELTTIICVVKKRRGRDSKRRWKLISPQRFNKIWSYLPKAGRYKKL